MGEGRRLLARRLRGVDAERPAGIVAGAERIRPARGRLVEAAGLRFSRSPFVKRRLSVAADIEDVRVGVVGGEREMNTPLAAGMKAKRDVAGFDRARQIKGGPGRAAIGRAE